MGRKKGDGEPEKMTTLKVRQDLLRLMKMVVTHRDIEMAEYTDNLLRPQVVRDYAKMIADLNAEQK